MSYSLFYNFTSALVLGPACPAGSRPGRGFEAPCPRPPPGGAGAPRQTRPGAVSGLLRPCFLVRGGAKTAARCVLLDSRSLTVAITSLENSRG
jgi:hypothetical protein